MMMVKATLTALKPRLRCVRFDAFESPSSVNQGGGWNEYEQVKFMQEMGLECLQVMQSEASTVRRIAGPTKHKQTTREICRGVELWLDR